MTDAIIIGLVIALAYVLGYARGEYEFKYYLYLKATQQGSKSFVFKNKWLKVEEE